MLLAGYCAAAVGGVGVSLWGKVLIAEYDSDDATFTDLERFDSVFATGGYVEFALFIAAAVAWLAWSSRTVDNEDALGIGPSKYTPRMAMAWWFLPFANLIVPYLVHRDVYDRYHRGVRVGAGIVILWWLAWIGSNIFENGVAVYWNGTETLADVDLGLTLWILAGIANTISAILAILLVQRIQGRADFLATSPVEPVTTSATLPQSPDVGDPPA